MPKSSIRKLLKAKKRAVMVPPAEQTLKQAAVDMLHDSAPLEAPVVAPLPFQDPLGLMPAAVANWARRIKGGHSDKKRRHRSSGGLRRASHSGKVQLAFNWTVQADGSDGDLEDRQAWARLLVPGLFSAGDGEEARFRGGLFRYQASTRSPQLYAGANLLQAAALTATRDGGNSLLHLMHELADTIKPGGDSNIPPAVGTRMRLTLAAALCARTPGLGLSALHCAAMRGNKQMCAALINGALAILRLRLVAVDEGSGGTDGGDGGAAASDPSAAESGPSTDDDDGVPASRLGLCFTDAIDDESKRAAAAEAGADLDSRVRAFRRFLNEEVEPANPAFEEVSWGRDAPGAQTSARLALVLSRSRASTRGPDLLATVQSIERAVEGADIKAQMKEVEKMESAGPSGFGSDARAKEEAGTWNGLAMPIPGSDDFVYLVSYENRVDELTLADPPLRVPVKEQVYQQVCRSLVGHVSHDVRITLEQQGAGCYVARHIDDEVILDGYQDNDVGEDDRWYFDENCARAAMTRMDRQSPPTAIGMSCRMLAPEGATALGLAALHCNHHVVSMLVLLGADAAAEDPDVLCGESCLHLAARASR